MQAIARVNRVFRDKPGGLIVDYLGLAHEFKRALATYTESGGGGQTALDQAEAVAVMLEKYEICYGLFHGFDRSRWVTGTQADRLGLLPAAQEHILAQENGKDRCVRSVRAQWTGGPLHLGEEPGQGDHYLQSVRKESIDLGRYVSINSKGLYSDAIEEPSLTPGSGVLQSDTSRAGSSPSRPTFRFVRGPLSGTRWTRTRLRTEPLRGVCVVPYGVDLLQNRSIR